MVPMIEVAARHASGADYFIVVGTSLVVYPAAGLVDYVPYDTPKYLVDPKLPAVAHPSLKMIEAKASEGLELVKKDLLKFV
jgi:NAD-dependent deacetylase